MNLDHDFFQMSKLSEDQKKQVFTKNETLFFPDFRWRPKKKVFSRDRTLFSPKSNGDLRSDAHQSQIIGGNADVDRTQILGGYSQIIGGYMPPRFWHPWLRAWVWILFGQSIFLWTLRQTQPLTWTYFLLFCWVMKQFNEFFEYIWKS